MQSDRITETSGSHQRDLLASPQTRLLFWLPWVLILIGCFIDGATRTVLWTIGFSLAGLGCLENVRRCGRRFCVYTGPIYLLAALASLLYGVQVLPLGFYGWVWILGIAVAASMLCGFVLERLLGKYPTAR
ncbi:MAG: hypothetical protein KGJ08_00905 [Gammaproteobacteria bacterium]|nr:hypothetical protein [Gammaproteobacteria bacterium]